MPDAQTLTLNATLVCLSSLGEETRLRLYALLSEAELAVSELVAILGQSQPRVSRHLRLLLEAGLVERHREGAWAFFRAAAAGPAAAIGRDMIARLDPTDPLLGADRARLGEVRAARAAQAAKYFAEQAPRWSETRRMHAPEADVEAAILAAARGAGGRLQKLLDIGVGTGRMLELLAGEAESAIGVDLSPAMLGVARAQIEKAGLRNVQLRQGDIYALPVESETIDLAVVHQVLHYLDDPGRALREAARALKSGGRIVVVDFAPHGEEYLREKHAHRRLGFSQGEVAGYLREAGLDVISFQELKPKKSGREPSVQTLTVALWQARRPDRTRQ